MQYDSSKRTIQLSIDTSIKYNKEKFARGYLHELLHHFTVEALQSPQNEREVEFQKSINKLYNNAKSLLKDKELYGLTNTFELVSQILPLKEDKVKDQTQTIIDNAPRYNLEVESIKRTKKFLEKQIQRLGDKLKTKGGSEQEE